MNTVTRVLGSCIDVNVRIDIMHPVTEVFDLRHGQDFQLRLEKLKRAPEVQELRITC